MTTRRVQDLTEKIFSLKKQHKEELANEKAKRDVQREYFLSKLRTKEETIKRQARECHENIDNERRQSNAIRRGLVEVSRPTQDYYDTPAADIAHHRHSTRNDTSYVVAVFLQLLESL